MKNLFCAAIFHIVNIKVALKMQFLNFRKKSHSCTLIMFYLFDQIFAYIKNKNYAAKIFIILLSTVKMTHYSSAQFGNNFMNIFHTTGI